MKKEEIRHLKIHRLAIWLGNTILISVIIAGMIIFGNISQANRGDFGSIINAGQSVVIIAGALGVIAYIAIFVLTVIMFFNVKKAFLVNRGYGIVSSLFLIISAILWVIALKIPLSILSMLGGSFGFGIAGLTEIKFLGACILIVMIHSLFQWIAGRTSIFEDKNEAIQYTQQDINETVIEGVGKPIEKAVIDKTEVDKVVVEETPVIQTVESIEQSVVQSKPMIVEKPIAIKTPILKSTPLVELYQFMNKEYLKNRANSQYWIFSVDSKIIKQEDGINKRFCKVSFFNRKMNEDNNLMRLYLNFNGDKITQERFEIDKKYNDRNIMFFIVERDLAEEEYIVEIESYIVDGKKHDIDERHIGDIEVNDDAKVRNVIIEKYFKSDDNNCLVVPHISDDYWICTCGFYNEVETESCPLCQMRKSLVKDMVDIKADDLLDGINDRVIINCDATIDSIINQYAESYYKNYGIDKQKVLDAIEKSVLIEKQKALIEQRIDQYLANKKISYKAKLPFEDNVVAYCEGVTNAVITSQMVLSQLNLQQLQYDYDIAVQTQQNNQEKLKKYLIIGGIAIGAIVILYTAYSLLFGNKTEAGNISESTVEETLKEKRTFEVITKEYNIKVGSTTRIEVSYVSSDITFESKNPLIASVSGDGYVTGVSDGIVEIDVYNSETDEKDTVNVKVTGLSGEASNYLIADSNTRVLEAKDLDLYNEEQLRIARNEIYARHGCYFKDEFLQSYFDSKSWYVKGTLLATEAYDLLSEMERKNAEFIRNYEKEKGYN